MRNEEDQQQALLIEWARLNQPQIPELFLLFHIGNGGYRNLLTAIKLKKAGVKPGVPDLFLAVPTEYYSGLFIEMKSKRGVVSDAQKKWIESLNNAGYLAVVCRGFEEAKTEILDYLKTREPMLII